MMDVCFFGRRVGTAARVGVCCPTLAGRLLRPLRSARLCTLAFPARPCPRRSMPPRRSARARTAVEREAAAAERETAARSARIEAAAERAAPALAPLPHALVLHILSLLPVDCRLLCAGVCRSWRAALEDTSLWIRLDLSSATGCLRRKAGDALLRAATARAAGHLETLDVSGFCDISSAALLRVMRGNSASLRELHMRGSELGPWWSVALVKKLLLAAPGLRACDAAVCTSKAGVARAVLRADPPFGALRLHCLSVGDDYDGDVRFEADAVLGLAADLRSCTFIRELNLRSAALDEPAVSEALVDAALACRLQSLQLECCRLHPAVAPALARLLGGGALAELEIDGQCHPLLDAPTTAVLANALRACSMLTVLNLRQMSSWLDPEAVTALLGALTGHVSLQSLVLMHNWIDAADPDAAGAALGALVGANSPALTALDVSACDLGDEGLGPLFDALPANTHLRTLDCTHNNLTAAFMRDVLLPAVRANASLQELLIVERYLNNAVDDSARAAEALVRRRRRAAR